MLGINEMNQELVRAFNINLCYNDIAITNLTVQNLDGKDHIIISFDKSMKHGQCVKYLSTLKNKIIKRFYKDEKAANVSYNLQSFPFNFNKGRLEEDNKGKRFAVEIDEGVVFNLKCYLAKALAGDVKEKMGREFGVQYAKEHVHDISFDRSSYLYCMRFDDWKLKVYFINSFSSKIARYEENAPRDYLEIIGNCVYIKKSIFDNVEFIKDIEAHNASLICRDFQTPSSKDEGVESLKFPIISFIRKTGVPVHSVIRTSYKGSNEDSVLIPIVAQNGKVDRLLNDNDAYRISSAFDMEVLSNVSESISARLPKSGSFDGVMYGIDFSDLDISHCVITKIIESSVINKDHELSIDPELVRALSPAQSPFNSPTHAGPSGLRTPPNQRKKDTDSGYDSNSPPRPKDSGSSSGDPRSLFEQPQTQEFPTRSQDVALKDSPRQESGVLHHHIGAAEVGAAENVPAGTSASNPCSSPAPGARFWPQVSSFVSGPSSSKGASERRTSALTEKEKELIEALLYTFNLINYTLDGVYTNFFAKDGEIVSLLHDSVDREKYLQAVRDYIIEEYCEGEEEAREVYDLDEFPFKFLPDPDYEKNKNDCEKNPKKTVVANISSGALSNLKILFSQRCEKNVDAIDINWVKDVEKREKYEWVDYQLSNRDSLEEACEGYSPDKKAIEEACEGCFPDEGAMKKIPIAFEEGEYVLDRSRDTCEVKLLFREQLRRFRDTSVAGKGKSEDNKDTGISSGEATDAENVSSKAEEKTSDYCSMSEPEPMDYQKSSPMQQQNSSQNTGGGSPKRTLELSMGMEKLAISTDLDATKVEQHSPIKKIRSN